MPPAALVSGRRMGGAHDARARRPRDSRQDAGATTSLLLRLVDRASEALFASGVLQVFQAFLLFCQSCLHRFHLLFLCSLAFHALGAIDDAGFRVPNGIL